MNKRLNSFLYECKQGVKATLAFTLIILLLSSVFTKTHADASNPESTTNRDAYVTAFKSARWTNEENGEAEVKVEIQSYRQENTPVKNLKNCDIIKNS